MTHDMTHNTTRYMKLFDTMISPFLSYKHSTLHFISALRLAAVLLVMIVVAQSLWG